MRRRVEWLAASGLSVAMVIATVVPYCLADALTQPQVFSGFLMNPIDGFSYLAKMRQGAEGWWLFSLPYAPEPGPGAFLFSFYLLLGKLARLLHLTLLTTFHLTRAIAGFGMFMAAFLFYRRTLSEAGVRWLAFVLTLCGAGLGWIAVPFGVQASDLSIPESIPFLSVYVNPHFPVATALILVVVLLVSGRGRLWGRSLACLLCGLCLALVLPFSTLTPAAALGLWLLWELSRAPRRKGLRQRLCDLHLHIVPYLSYLAGAAPVLIYDFALSRLHPAISVWTTQNRTPSPPPGEVLLGYGLVLLLAVVGGFHPETRRRPMTRLLLVWSLSNLLLLYAPFSLQRRLSLGLYFPLAALAALGLRGMLRGQERLRPVAALVLLMSIPSNFIVVSAGIYGVQQGDPAVIHRQEELRAYRWLDKEVESSSLVLAGPETGNRLPAFASVRVMYGHPFETPHAAAQERRVKLLYGWKGSSSRALQVLQAFDVDYVYYSQREEGLGPPRWLQELTPVYHGGGVKIFKVPAP